MNYLGVLFSKSKLYKILFISTFLFFQAADGQQKKTVLLNTCGLLEAPKAEYDLTYNKRLEYFIQKIISSTGFGGNSIHISSSPDVKYAITGLRSDGNAEVVVNDQFDPNENFWYNKIILVHEIAHVLNGDIFNAIHTILMKELGADYSAGFWSGRMGLPIDSAKAPFIDLPDAAGYPDKASRLNSVDSGWHVAKNSITPAEAPTASIKYEKYLNLYFTVTNQPKLPASSGKYKVYFHLASRNMNLPFDSISPQISKVSYVLHKTFRHQLVTSYNVNDDAFGYSLTKVWRTFPLVCLVYFRDNSVLPIIKEFSLSKDTLEVIK